MNWENGGRSLLPHLWYKYKGKKFLSTSREGSTITAIDVIGPVLEVCSDDDEDHDNLHTHKTNYWENIHISGVLQLDSYSGCMKCTAKVLPLLDDAVFGQ